MSAEIVPSSDGGLELSKNLHNTPGWVVLSENERTEVLNLTSDILKSLQGSNMLALRGAIGVLRMERYLEGKAISFTRWAESSLGPSRATIFRMKRKIQKALGRHSEDALLYLADHGIPGANNVQLGHIVNALEKAQPIKSSKASEYKGFAEGVGKILSTGYSERRRGAKPIELSSDGALVALILTARRVMREAKLGSSAEQRAWLRRAVGYIMELRAIQGTIQAERTPLPDGLIPKRGAPRGPRKKRKKSA